MNTKVLVGVLAVGAIGLLVVVSNVGDDEESAFENEIVTENEIANEVSLPGDLPPNIPMYPGAVLKGVQDVPNESDRNITLTLETPDSAADVNTWYRGALAQAPWAVTSDRNVSGYILLKGENGNVAVFTQVAPRSDLGVSVITQRIQIK